MRVGHLLKELLGELLNYDHKVFSSFWLLISRPGFLAAEYLEGRRARHLSPLRLYVVTSFVTFFLFSFVPAGQHGKAAPKPVDIQIEGVELVGPLGGTHHPKPGWASELKARTKQAQADPDRFKQTFFTHLSRALFLLMPMFALLLFLLHLRRGTLFIEHLVLSLHYHAFSFLVILALMGLALLPGEGWGTWPGLVIFCLPPVYLALALQRLHHRGWFRSILKAVVVSTVYGMALAVALLGLLYLSLPSVAPAAGAV